VDNYNLEVNFTNFEQRVEVGWGFFVRNVELTADLGGDFIGFSSEQGCSLVPSATNPSCTSPPIPCLDNVNEDVWSLYF